MNEWLRECWEWLLDVTKAYHGWLGGSALAAIIGLGQDLKFWQADKRAYIVLIVTGFVYSFFETWRKEYVPNRKGPNLIIQWHSGAGEDSVSIQNVGPEMALNILPGKLSWPEVTWLFPKEIQSISGNGEGYMEMAFVQIQNGKNLRHTSLKRLFNTPDFTERDTLELDLSFSNIHGARFTRTFVLKRPRQSTSVMADLGKLRVSK